ncbi:MAG: Iron-sulfur assembly protein 1 [Alyxoria varia]|nr:MAG: Iron-sulfur assembly protein 1 [Alyxoria varia]
MALSGARSQFVSTIPPSMLTRNFTPTQSAPTICASCLRRLERRHGQQRLQHTEAFTTLHSKPEPDLFPRRQILPQQRRTLPKQFGARVFAPASRRYLATAEAYRPESLDPEPPPRNAGVPDTSIATSEAERTSDRFPHFQDHSLQSPEKSYTSTPNASQREGEGEAQISRPATNTQNTAEPTLNETATSPSSPQTSRTNTTASQNETTPSSTSTAPSPSTATTQSTTTSSTNPAPRKSKLRPRKAAMNLTPAAIHHLQALLSAPTPKLIRVGVKNRGCSGLAYNLEYVEQPGKFDEQVEQEGVRVLIDSRALFSIIGSEMDWVEDKLSARFVFRNPNITEQCGCGESFSIS